MAKRGTFESSEYVRGWCEEAYYGDEMLDNNTFTNPYEQVFKWSGQEAISTQYNGQQ